MNIKIQMPDFSLFPVNYSKNTVFRGNGVSHDVFEKSASIDKEEKMTSIPDCIKETADNCAAAAKSVKRYYDNLYGENNWEYISIGRSCAKVADSLNKLGVSSHIIPISGLSEGIENGEEIGKMDGFEEFKNYIYELGLTPFDIKNSNKVFIFQDYKDRGGTLKHFEEFIRSAYMGLDFENVKFESINDVIDKSLYSKTTPRSDLIKLLRFKTSLMSQFTFNSIKSYTNIKKLPADKLKDIGNGIYDKALPTHDDFNFALAYYLDQTAD
ncbi:MAG: hypothetical protein LUE64_00725 [Candidatus Gastranaerophilales bacterium]|nr:hypothetical protein [Candidatus Gastranaerophilales bacterium]